MKGFGCQDKIRIGDREFQIHTGCDTNKNKALTEVFEKGNFIFDIVKPYKIRQRTEDKLDEKYLKKAVADLHQNVIDEILLLFQISHKIKPLNQHISHFRLGKVFLAKNFYKEAVENLVRAVELNPDHVQSAKLLGVAYLKINNFKSALRTFESALQKSEKDPDLFNCMGVLYTQMGNYTAAKDVLQKAMNEYTGILELNLNFGIVLFLSTIAENPNTENFILPARVVRVLKEIREQERYRSTEWQQDFDHIMEAIETGKKSNISEALFNLQIKMITEGNLYIDIDLFFLKFMFGGREMSRKEIDFYERKILNQSTKYKDSAEYWNEVAVLHLIQCRDNFLKAIDDFENSTKLNSKFQDALDSLELLKRGKKGFLILLRAILK